MPRARAPFKYINAVGIELEGAWDKSRRLVRATYHEDGSVEFNSDDDLPYEEDDDGGYQGITTGEYVSEPMKSPESVIAFLKSNYPDFVNDSCGLHVHVSFKHPRWSGYTLELAFYEAFKARMAKLGEELGLVEDHRFWTRLEGEGLNGSDSYCEAVWKPDRQFLITEMSGDRYTALNYSYAKHGTMENRLFPCFVRMATATKAVMAYLKFVEDYIEARKEQPEMSIAGAMDLPSPLVVEVRDVLVPA